MLSIFGAQQPRNLTAANIYLKMARDDGRSFEKTDELFYYQSIITRASNDAAIAVI
jgi:hypothetical protein